MNKWVTAECPVRVDVAGGWSDTPPITYEHAGAVVNVAITVDGKVHASYCHIYTDHNSKGKTKTNTVVNITFHYKLFVVA